MSPQRRTALVAVSLFVAGTAIDRLARGGGHVEPAWYAFVVLAVVMAIDASRALVSLRASRRFESAAFSASALHFASDFAGSAAVLAGLVVVRAGYPRADAA